MVKSPQHELARYLNILLGLVLKYLSRYIVEEIFECVDE